MINVDIFVDIATAALAVLIALLACYLSLRLLGKLAKFLIVIVVIALVAWFVFSDHSVLRDYIDMALPFIAKLKQ